MCLELSDFNEHTCVLFVEVSFYPVLKVVWETRDSLCLGTAIEKHAPSWIRCLGILKAKIDFTESNPVLFLFFFFFHLFQKQLLPRGMPIMDQNLVPLWNMGKLLDNLQL